MKRRFRSCARAEAGFTLIELMIAIGVAVFLLGGLLVILQNMGRTRTNQTDLAQLQDNQRLAMTLITDVVQAAGYFPDPTTTTLVASLPATTVAGVALSAGQGISGSYLADDPGDTLTARYTTASNDTIINCVGGTNTSGANVSYVNTFSVKDGQLVCSLNGAATVPLIDKVKRLDVLYGVKRSFALDNNNVDTYLRADQVLAADWPNVTSVKVRITFDNPIKEPGQPATIQFTRIITVMGRAGVKT